MPSENKTPNLGLNLWKETEYPVREDFVRDNALIDAAVGDISEMKTAGGTGTAITLSIPSVVAYKANQKFTFIASANNAGNATTIKVNALAVKPLYKPNTTMAPNIVAGKAYEVWYNQSGDCFFLKASAEGNAIAAEVLAGKTFSNDDDTGIVGSMANRGSVGIQNLTSEGAEYTIPQGYHNGLGKVKAVISGLIASVIKAGTTVGGIIGTFTADANAISSHLLSGKTAYVNGSKVIGTIPSKSASTITPGTANQTIAAGQYLSGEQTIEGDADLVASNIKAGANIFGVDGAYEGDDINNQDIVSGLAMQSIAKNDPVYLVEQLNQTKLPDLPSLPSGYITKLAFSPDGVYLACSHPVSPYVTVYKRNGEEFTKLPNPSVLPSYIGMSVKFSPDGNYLAVGHQRSDGSHLTLTIYKRNGDTFTKLPNVLSVPYDQVKGLSFSPDGVYLACSHVGSPFLTIYKRNGDTFTKLPNPSVFPTSTGEDVVFSPDGVHLVVAHGGHPNITIYKRNGDSFTKLQNPSVLPASTGLGANFSPDGIHLVVGNGGTPSVTIYKKNNDVFSKLQDPAGLPVNAGYCVVFSPDGRYVGIGHGDTPCVTIFRRYKDRFTKQPTPLFSETLKGPCYGIDFDLTGQNMCLSTNVVPSVSIYKNTINSRIYKSDEIFDLTEKHGAGYAKKSGNINDIIEMVRIFR